MTSGEQENTVTQSDSGNHEDEQQISRSAPALQFFENVTTDWQNAYPGEVWSFTNYFSPTFSSPPQIVSTFNYFDVNNNAIGQTFRLSTTYDKSTISSSSVASFINGWADTTVNGASTLLMAIPPEDLRLQSDTVSVPAGGCSTYVQFPKVFNNQPQVFCTFTALDLDTGYRLLIDVSDITVRGFVLDVSTWGAPTLNSATIQWFAWPGHQPQIGYYSEHRVGEEKGSTGEIKFYQNFNKPPQIFMGITKMDIAGAYDARLRLTVNNLTNKGFDWAFETWADTIIYELRVTYLAIGNYI